MRYKSCQQEKRIASRFNDGRQVIGSGSTPFLKGDVITSDLFIEAKTKARESKSITVKKEWIQKAKEQMYQMRKDNFALALSFGDGKDYMLIESEYFVELYDAAHKKRNVDGKN